MGHGANLQPVNRLSESLSPYLQEHALNPVAWQEWGPEAFSCAAAANKLIFLSIGYSSCHWCHVMASESFEDADVAEILNERFVSIKVDREERPDIDGVYMMVCQLMTGRGGWPLSVVMTPDGLPVFAGTYIPKESRRGACGLIELLTTLSDIWEDEPERLFSIAEKMSEALDQITCRGVIAGEAVSPEVVDMAFHSLSECFDSRYGGFGDYQKFPSPHNLLFLLSYYEQTGEESALRMVEKTFQSMFWGGMRDHLGGGYHRYSTDREWLLPHFEKMLYDQAMIAYAAGRAHEITNDAFYRDVACCALDYILSSLRNEQGGFHSAVDADSQGEEGRFYTWTWDELASALNTDELALVKELYNVSERGNFRDEATGERSGRNVLHCLGTVSSDIDKIRVLTVKLRKSREERPFPRVDDKILTDWNGLAIAALAYCGRAFSKPEYVEAAEASLKFVHTSLRDETGRLLHRYRNHESGIPGFLDDHAFLAWGVLELYEATGEAAYLQEAIEIMGYVGKHFSSESGAFSFSSALSEKLVASLCEGHDGPYPSGNSVAAHILIRLWEHTGEKTCLEKARLVVNAFKPLISRAPAAHVHLISLLFGLPQEDVRNVTDTPFF